eukprot:COSAG03_NODE_6_length_26200_cov_62.015517_11_plen_97_part_00
MSYFVGAENVDRGYEEAGGFATNAGKGWAKVVYENHNIVTKGEVAIAMGIYGTTLPVILHAKCPKSSARSDTSGRARQQSAHFPAPFVHTLRYRST